MHGVAIKRISVCHPDLVKVISASIGYPTTQKVQRVLKSYEGDNQYLIGCFLKETLVGVVGVEVLGIKISIRHISVLENLRKKGIGRELINFVLADFSLSSLSAETDGESVKFYKSLGFNCSEFTSLYGNRYMCTFSIDKEKKL